MNLRPLPERVEPLVVGGMPNPWAVRNSRLGRVVIYTSSLRAEVVREADVEHLRRFIAWPGTQAHVRKFAESRLRRLLELSPEVKAQADPRAASDSVGLGSPGRAR